MENFDNLEQPVALEVTENAKNYLKNTAPWSKFIAILQFIIMSFALLGALIMIVAGPFIGKYTQVPFSLSLLGFIYLVVAIIIFIPALYLYRFSQKAASVAITNNPLELEESLKNMKSYWKFTGIMTIVVFALSITVVPIIVIAVAMGGAFAH